jgi:cysteine desulfurase/selenocysteine lyase
MITDDAPAKVSEQLRAGMPVAHDYAYFDHAAVAPLPSRSAAAICQYAREAECQGDVGWLSWSAEIGRLRDKAAQLLAARSTEIALVGNTTLGINLVAEGVPWIAGDNVVVLNNEFPSNFLPWHNLQRLGVELRQVAAGSRGEVLLDDIAAAMDQRTRLLAISWVGFASGFRLDVGEVVQLAHARKCLVFLDAIQGLGAFPLSVAETDVDFVCADGHKWMLGPEGAGILFVKEQHLEWLTPMGLGWNSLAAGAFEPGATDIKKDAGRYEGGTICLASMLGLSASLDFLLEVGTHRDRSSVAGAVLSNVADLEQRLRTAGFLVALPENRRHRSGIVPISWPRATTEALGAARKHLLKRKIVTSVRGGYLRASAHAYNNAEDNMRLVDGLIDFCRTQ